MGPHPLKGGNMIKLFKSLDGRPHNYYAVFNMAALYAEQ